MEFTSTLMALPVPLSAAVIVGGTVLLALVAYGTTRALLAPRADGEARDLAGSVIFRVAALHGLILALVFAEELVTQHSVERTVSHEAALTADVFYDLVRYDADGTLEARRDLARYVAIVSGAEWRLLAAEGVLSDEAWRLWSSAYEQILDLDPEGLRQEALKPIMLEHIRQVPELRRARLEAANDGADPFFMAAAIVGVVLTAMSFFTFAPRPVNLLLLSIFGAYTGLVIYFIVVFANPYLPPGAIQPESFQALLEGDVARLAAEPL